MEDRYMIVKDDWNSGCEKEECDEYESYRVLDTVEDILASPSMCQFHAEQQAEQANMEEIEEAELLEKRRQDCVARQGDVVAPTMNSTKE